MSAKQARDNLFHEVGTEPEIACRLIDEPSLTDPKGWRQRVLEAAPLDARHKPCIRGRKIEKPVVALGTADDALHSQITHVMHMLYALWNALFKRGSAVIEEVKRRMDELGATQAEVATACGITQPHLSKILSRTVKPGPKTKQRLTDWLAATSSANPDEPAPDLAALVQRLARLAPAKRIQIMHLLETIEGIVRR